MKKILLALAAVICSMTASAQMIEIVKTEGGQTTTVTQYINTSTAKYNVVLKKIPTTGTAKATINGQEVDVKWVQLWENGPKWAEFNVGATSISECGNYYNWGASAAQTAENCNTYSSQTGDIQGTTDDTAKAVWGNNWVMPTDYDFLNLFGTKYTDGGVWKSATDSGYGIAGWLVTGKAGTIYSTTTLFLPAAGSCGDGTVAKKGEQIHYWTSKPDDDDDAIELCDGDVSDDDDDGKSLITTNDGRWFGNSIRAILKE